LRLWLFFFGLIFSMATHSVTTHYRRIRGAEKNQALVARVYRRIDELPQYHGIRQLQPDNLQGSQKKLFRYFSGSMAAPARQVQKYGQPMLRRRHRPFSIRNSECDQWLPCMHSAPSDKAGEAGLRCELPNTFAKVTNHMRNQQT
jgi:hemoglobin